MTEREAGVAHEKFPARRGLRGERSGLERQQHLPVEQLAQQGRVEAQLRERPGLELLQPRGDRRGDLDAESSGTPGWRKRATPAPSCTSTSGLRRACRGVGSASKRASADESASPSPSSSPPASATTSRHASGSQRRAASRKYSSSRPRKAPHAAASSAGSPGACSSASQAAAERPLRSNQPAGQRALDRVEGERDQVPVARAERAALELAVEGRAGSAAVLPDGAAQIGVERALQRARAAEGAGLPAVDSLRGRVGGRGAEPDRRDPGARGDPLADDAASGLGAARENAADEVGREVRMIGAAADLGVERPLGGKARRVRRHRAVRAGRARLLGRGPSADLDVPALVGTGQHLAPPARPRLLREHLGEQLAERVAIARIALALHLGAPEQLPAATVNQVEPQPGEIAGEEAALVERQRGRRRKLERGRRRGIVGVGRRVVARGRVGEIRSAARARDRRGRDRGRGPRGMEARPRGAAQRPAARQRRAGRERRAGRDGARVRRDRPVRKRAAGVARPIRPGVARRSGRSPPRPPPLRPPGQSSPPAAGCAATRCGRWLARGPPAAEPGRLARRAQWPGPRPPRAAPRAPRPPRPPCPWAACRRCPRATARGCGSTALRGSCGNGSSSGLSGARTVAQPSIESTTTAAASGRTGAEYNFKMVERIEDRPFASSASTTSTRWRTCRAARASCAPAGASRPPIGCW